MDINFQTKNLIIIHFNPGAGGKFLSMCLALNENVLPLQPLYAKNKLLKHWSENKSFRATMSVLKLSEKTKTHLEFSHGVDLYGFSYIDDYSAQIKKSNKFFKDLTNQKKYFFFLTNHFTTIDIFTHFKKAKNIIIINDERLLKIRKKKGNTNFTKISKKFKDCFLFDISTVRNNELFYNEIKNLCGWLKLEIKNNSLLADLRKQFVKNLKINILKSNPEWDGKGYYRGLRAKN
jgi:hypothetical protein